VLVKGCKTSRVGTIKGLTREYRNEGLGTAPTGKERKGGVTVGVLKKKKDDKIRRGWAAIKKKKDF